MYKILITEITEHTSADYLTRALLVMDLADIYQLEVRYLCNLGCILHARFGINYNGSKERSNHNSMFTLSNSVLESDER